MSPVSTTSFDSKFIHTVSTSTLNQGVDYVVLSKDCSNRLPELLADESKIIITENTNVSALSSKLYNTYKLPIQLHLMLNIYNLLCFVKFIFRI